jgi:hypothetical protein
MNLRHKSLFVGLKAWAVILSAVLICAFSIAYAQEGDLPYATGFEPPTFVLGELDGQDVWLTLVAPTSSAVISDTNPASGLQSMEVFGDQLAPHVDIPGILTSQPRIKFAYDGFVRGTSLVELSVDALLDGPPTDYDLVSANLTPFVSGWYLGDSLFVSSNGNVFICGCDEPGGIKQCPVTIPIEPGEYQRLSMRIDFSTRATQYFVNGDWSARLFTCRGAPTSLFFKGNFLSLNAVADPSVVDPSEYTAFFDNYSAMAYKTVPFDVRPSRCPNWLITTREAPDELLAAIVGTEELAVSSIDAASIRLFTAQGKEGIKPLRWVEDDVARPYQPYTGKERARDCNSLRPDRIADLVLVFDRQEIITELGTGDGSQRSQRMLFTVKGNLNEAFDNTPILGEDVVVVVFPKTQ